MVSSISAVSGIVSAEPIRPAGVSQPEGGFQKVLDGAIRSVEGFSADASASVERFLAGEGEDLHTAALATQKAELAFEMFMQARNKVVNAYQEIMRMQI